MSGEGAPQVAVSERDLLVLVKLLGMLGSENPHERAAFGAKAHAWVAQRGLEWSKLLIPPEDEPVTVEVNVGGKKAASAGPHASTSGGPSASGANGAPAHNWASGPAWGPLAEQMLANHADRLKGDRETTFLTDQVARAMKYGNGTRVSDKQEAWLRDILGRAGLTW